MEHAFLAQQRERLEVGFQELYNFEDVEVVVFFLVGERGFLVFSLELCCKIIFSGILVNNRDGSWEVCTPDFLF